MMARPLSEEKRMTLIDTATEAVALMGTGASTAKIASAAGVSEGTVFTYFPTKDELLNTVYLEIKRDLARAMLDGYPAQAGLEQRMRHVWDSYIGWGHKHPAKRKAMQQLTVSEKVTAESRREGSEIFAVVNALLTEGLRTDPLQERASMFNGALLESLAETTLEFMAREPSVVDAYRQSGFAFFWKGLSN
jgi:AcrR family transcriptional regulator